MLNLYDYIADNTYFKKFAVNDLMYVEYKCLIEEAEFWSHHNYFVYIMGGKMKWQTAKNDYIAGKGESIYIRKGAYVAEKYHDEDFCGLIFFVPDEFIKSIVSKSFSVASKSVDWDKEMDSIIPIHIDETLAAFFNSIMSYFPKDITPPRELLNIKFEELILTILTSSTNRSLASYLRSTTETSKVSIPSIMESNFMRNLSLEEYARLCARSLSAFKTDFQNIYKTSPGKWLINKRLEYAKFLVETTDKSVHDIVCHSGFKNISHFVRIFKETYGQPPMKYRFA
jgi:AraC-like DNA-binding protein